MPEDRCVFAGLTVAENLRLAERPASPRTTRSSRSFPSCDARRQRAGTLSGGQQQMVAIGRVLLNDNRLLLVDEPTKGLAPKVVTEVAEVLERVAESVPVLLVEQNLAVVERVAQHAVVLAAGRVDLARRRELLLGDRAMTGAARRQRRRSLSTVVLLTLTGLGLAALYFLVASGLSLVFGLADVLNFAHGAFLPSARTRPGGATHARRRAGTAARRRARRRRRRRRSSRRWSSWC